MPSRRTFIRSGGVLGGTVLGGWYLLDTDRMPIHLSNWTDEPRSLDLVISDSQDDTIFERTIALGVYGRDSREQFDGVIPQTRFPYERYRAVGRLSGGERRSYTFANKMSHSHLEVEIGADETGPFVWFGTL